MTTVATAADTFSVFGTTATLVVSEPAAVPVARAVADTELAAVDQACSRFRPDSELSRLNAAGGGPRRQRPVRADPRRGAARGPADRRRRRPDLRRAAGRHRLRPRFRAADGGRRHRAAPGRAAPGARLAQRAAGPVRGRARLRRGAQLDLGATAKAWAADRCAAMIAARTGSGVLVSLGGDIAVAGTPPDAGWRIGSPMIMRRAGRARQTVTIAPAAWPPRALRSAPGRWTAGGCITSSTPPPASRPGRAGVRSAWPRAAAWMPTRPAPRPSSAAPRRRPGCGTPAAGPAGPPRRVGRDHRGWPADGAQADRA